MIFSRRSLVGVVAMVIAGLGLGLAGCQSSARKKDYDPVLVRFFLEATAGEQAAVMRMPLTGVELRVRPKAVFVETDIVNAEVVRVDMGLCLLIQVTPAAARDLFRLTGTNQGRRLVMGANEVPLGSRLIDGPFIDGNILTFIEMPDDDLPALVASIKRTSEDLQREVARR
jgi:hypothetical protein